MENILVESFRNLAKRHREVIQSQLIKKNVYIGQHRILFKLQENPDMTLTELTDALDVSKESLSVSVRRLEQSGLIRKLADTKDKRRILISLTDLGVETSDACKTYFNNINASMFKNMSQEEKDLLEVLFSKMIQGLEEVDDEKNI
ncbi:MAG: MarR family transcriptional regulator [Erysipelothrix sp.]|nr:MarR family transcriptional regulator [Erysipelothrix sp.]